jgi:hypothetical protein
VKHRENVTKCYTTEETLTWHNSRVIFLPSTVINQKTTHNYITGNRTTKEQLHSASDISHAPRKRFKCQYPTITIHSWLRKGPVQCISHDCHTDVNL